MKPSTRWIGSALVIATAVGAWLLIQVLQSSSDAPAAAQSESPPAAPVTAVAVAAPSTTAASASTLTANAAPSSAPRRLVPCDPKQIVLPDPNAPEVTATTASLPGSALFASIGRTLASSAEPTARAAALFLASIDTSVDEARCVGNDCTEAMALRGKKSAETASALATLVQTANVPAAYSWAITACQYAHADAATYPACGSLSLQHWAQAAPDNAWPWLTLANEARQRGDVAGVESAMHRASLSRDWMHPAAEIRRLLAASMPADTASADFIAVVGRTVNFDGGKLAGLSALSRYCDDKQDANRRQTCTRLADAALDSAQDLLQLSIATTVGKRTGLAAERIERAVTRKEQAQQALTATIGDPREWTWDNAATKHCRFVNQQAQIALRTAEVGEVAAALELLPQR